MKKYPKDEIIKVIRGILIHHSENKVCLRFSKLLINKLVEQEEITLSKEEITDLLFDKENNEINVPIFNILRSFGADMKGVNFDGKIINNLHFNGLENVEINLDEVPDKDLSNTCLKGVTLTGSLDGAKIEYTDFTGYIGNLTLNTEKIKNKSIKGSKLCGVTVKGSLANIVISNVDFSGAKGEIIINPQDIPSKELYGINFSNTKLVGDYNSLTKKYEDPIFNGCKIYNCKFKNASGNLFMNLDTINIYFNSKLCLCDLTGVTVVGHAKSNYEKRHCVEKNGTVLFHDVNDDLFGSYYTNSQGKTVRIHLYESMVWDEDGWKYIPRKEENNLKIDVEYKPSQKPKSKFLSFLKLN